MFREIVLGIAQGLTEFIPVSSSSHLILIPFLFRWPAPDLAFDVGVHLGTALAVVAYFARDLSGMVLGTARWLAGRRGDEDRGRARLLGLLLIGSIPAGIAGIFLEGLFEDLFNDTDAVDRVGAPITAIGLLVTATLLITAERVLARRRGDRPPEKDVGRGIEQIRPVDAVVIGLFQAVAIEPGISRSGATIAGGVFRGLRREAAARFSFLLSLPAILGAAAVALPDVPSDADLGPLVVGAVAAAIMGFVAIAFLMRYLRTRSMRPFAAYCVLLSAIALAFWSQIR